jgi:hypothetical protein
MRSRLLTAPISSKIQSTMTCGQLVVKSTQPPAAVFLLFFIFAHKINKNR